MCQQIIFLGGTALRILYNNARFSEDLDFDSFGIDLDEFTNLGEIIKENLEREGLKVEIEVKTKNNLRIKIRIPELLFNLDISPLLNQKILIQVDVAPKMFDYVPDEVILNKFEVFTKIYTTPKDILLSQKFILHLIVKELWEGTFLILFFFMGLEQRLILIF